MPYNPDVRIISGRFKNRSVNPPGLRRIAPTTEYFRDMVFSIIGPEAIREARFLDLFCGSGAVGLEAISRGAEFCTFVDNDCRLVASLSNLVKQWQIADCTSVNCTDVMKWLIDELRQTKGSHEKPFNFVYAHPPRFMRNSDRFQMLMGLFFATISEAKTLFSEKTLLFLEIPRNELELSKGNTSEKSRRRKTNLATEEPSERYRHQFDIPWCAVLRTISIPLEFPLFDWRMTGATTLLIFGAIPDESTREII